MNINAPIPVINKLNNSDRPSSRNSKFNPKEGTQFVYCKRISPLAIAGTCAAKKLNNAMGSIANVMLHFERKNRPNGTKRMDIINPDSTINNMVGFLIIMKVAKILKKNRFYAVICIKIKIKYVL